MKTFPKGELMAVTSSSGIQGKGKESFDHRLKSRPSATFSEKKFGILFRDTQVIAITVLLNSIQG